MELHVRNQHFCFEKKNKQTCIFNHHSMSESSKRLETRPSNSKTHPGISHNRYTSTRRSTAEVRAEKDAKAAAKAEKLAQKQKGLQETAKIEQQTRQKMQGQKNHTGVFASSLLSIPRKRNERPVQNAVAKGCF
jgi:hypothetical protein